MAQPFVPPPYPYDRLDEIIALAAKHDGGAIDLSIGTPFDPPPTAVLEVLARADGVRGYPPSIGSLAVRRRRVWVRLVSTGPYPKSGPDPKDTGNGPSRTVVEVGGLARSDSGNFTDEFAALMQRLRAAAPTGAGERVVFSIDLLRDAVVLGLLLGCFYAAVSVGLSISFGLLDVPQVAHPAFLVLASYGVYLLNDSYDIDPLVAGLIITPLFFLLGFVAYRLYYESFERRGSDAGVRGIAFFFGIAFIIEVLIIMVFGVDQRSVTAPYIGKAWRIGDMRMMFRMLSRRPRSSLESRQNNVSRARLSLFKARRMLSSTV